MLNLLLDCEYDGGNDKKAPVGYTDRGFRFYSLLRDGPYGVTPLEAHTTTTTTVRVAADRMMLCALLAVIVLSKCP